MPFDTTPTTGSPDVIKGGTPSNPAAARILWPNFVRFGGLVDFSAESGRPNPSSAQPHAPASRLWQANRRLAWKTAGYFCISSDTTLDYELAPNYQLSVTDSGGSSTIECRSTTPTTHYQDPRDLAAFIQSQLNADATLNGTYTVSYSLTTYKFTISCDETFTLTAGGGNDIMDTLGYTATKSGATSYTADQRRIHTEEYVAIRFALVDYGITPEVGWVGGKTTDYWRWLALLNPNFPMVYNATAGADKVQLFVGSILQTVEDDPTPDILHNFGTSLGTNEWNDVYARGGIAVGTTWTPTIHIVDVEGVNGDGLDDHSYIKIKIVNRQNPAGHLELGYLFAGPGWYPIYNHAMPWEFGPEDRSELSTSDGGDDHSSFHAPRKVARLPWDRSYVDQDDHTFLTQMMLGARRQDPNVSSRSTWDLRLIGGLHHPSILLLSDLTTNLDDGAKGEIAGNAIFGRARVSLPGEAVNGHYNLSIDFTEEPP